MPTTATSTGPRIVNRANLAQVIAETQKRTSADRENKAVFGLSTAQAKARCAEIAAQIPTANPDPTRVYPLGPTSEPLTVWRTRDLEFRRLGYAIPYCAQLLQDLKQSITDPQVELALTAFQGKATHGYAERLLVQIARAWDQRLMVASRHDFNTVGLMDFNSAAAFLYRAGLATRATNAVLPTALGLRVAAAIEGNDRFQEAC